MKSALPILALFGALGTTWCAAQQTAPQTIVSISIEDAIKRAQSANVLYSSANADVRFAQSSRTIARSALLPNVVYHNQFLYTQGTGRPVTAPVKFIANNAVHEYVSQGSVTETIVGIAFSDLKRTEAEAAAARARFEVARRGLVFTVVGNYYAVLAADAKLAVSQRSLEEATHFSSISQKRESNGEVSHADTVRADLQVQQRQRELNDAKIAADRALLDLGVMLFNDPATPYKLTDAMDQLPVLPPRSEIEAAAMANNPELKVAIEALLAAGHAVTAARFGYFPDLVLNYSYGIDAPQFAVHAPDGTRNLGYAASATLDIPVWDWFATRSRVHDSLVRREQAKTELTVAQRQLIASLNGAYQEAQVSLDQLRLLDRTVQSATESLRLTNLRYSAGEGTVLEVVDSENTLVQAETSRTDGAARYFNALANLQTLTGSMPR